MFPRQIALCFHPTEAVSYRPPLSVSASPLVASRYIIWASSLSLLLNLTLIHSDKYDATILALGHYLSKDTCTMDCFPSKGQNKTYHYTAFEK